MVNPPMDMLNQNKIKIWHALEEFIDYFSCLGGAGRYPGMDSEEIPLYIGYYLITCHNPSFQMESYMNRRFLKAAAPVLGRVNGILDNVSVEGEQFTELMIEYLQDVNAHLKPALESRRWQQFVHLISEKINF